jgi:hypothetical protein
VEVGRCSTQTSQAKAEKKRKRRKERKKEENEKERINEAKGGVGTEAGKDPAGLLTSYPALDSLL